MQSKSLWQSKTVWVAVAQAAIAILIAANSVYPQIGIILVIKSLVDVALRMATTQPVTLSANE